MLLFLLHAEYYLSDVVSMLHPTSGDVLRM